LAQVIAPLPAKRPPNYLALIAFANCGL
jgi:hypothetical protein